MSWLTEVPIAHRGLHDGHVPENSLAAFGAAAQHGYPIELDVHLLADQSVVVSHDETLDRMTDRRGELRLHTRRTLAGVRLCGSRLPMPFLDEVLEAVDGTVPLLVELKSPDPVGRLEAAVWDLLRDYQGPFAVQSFNPRSVAWFRDHAPAVTRGQLGTDRPHGRHGPGLDRSGSPSFVAYELGYLPQPQVTRARAEGLPLLAWTVKTEGERRRAERVADNYLFEGIVPGGSGGWAAPNRPPFSEADHPLKNK